MTVADGGMIDSVSHKILQGGSTVIPQGTDAALLVKFFTDARHYPSTDEWHEHLFIHITTPGDLDSPIENLGPVNLEKSAFQKKQFEMYKRRFARQWDAYVRSEEVVVDGTPLTELAGITMSEVKTMQAKGVMSVEQLTACSGEQISMLGHGAKERQSQAKIMIEQRESGRPLKEIAKRVDAAEAENEKLRAEIAMLKGKATSKQPTRAAAKPKPKKKKKAAPKKVAVPVAEPETPAMEETE